MITHRLVVRDVPYKIEEKLGTGLHSTVYSARDLRTGQLVAIKRVNFMHGTIAVQAETESQRKAFWKELQLLLYLQPLNPYIIRVFNYECKDNYGIIVMERGQTFRDTLSTYALNGTRMSPTLIRRFWLQMVQAIYYMHQTGIVHSDCKPENFIQLDSDNSALRLIDMGISFQLPPNVTSRLLTAAGTPDYVCPEMVNSRVASSIQSKYGYKVDVWALGVILYEMTFGVRPLAFLRTTEAKLAFLERLKGGISIPKHPDKQLRDILKRCLRSNPHERPDTQQLLNHPYLHRGRW